MKPRNAYERKVVELKAQLLSKTNEIQVFAVNGCFNTLAATSRKKTYCLDCNEVFLLEQVDNNICPGCGNKFKLLGYNEACFSQEVYIMSMEIVENFQVLRYFLIKKLMKKTSLPYFSTQEIMQDWIDSSGRTTTFSKTRAYNYYSDGWLASSEMSLKDQKYQGHKYMINPDFIFPQKRVLLELRRNGFKSSFHNITPVSFVSSILSDSKSETLLKLKQYSLLKMVISNKTTIHSYWNALKICFRNNYTPVDWNIYFDYLKLLEEFDKDILNLKYVCPTNLKKEHDKYVSKKMALMKLQKKEEQIQKMRIFQENYEKEKGCFFGLSFQSEQLSVSVLNSVEEFRLEGEIMNHCVFTTEYFAKKESLVFSAKTKDKTVATIEFSLSEMDVVQCYGANNDETPYKDEIINILRTNKNIIEQRLTMVA